MHIRPMISKISVYIVRRTFLLFLCVLIIGLLYTYATRDMSFINLNVGKLINLDNVQSLQVSDGMGDLGSPLIKVTDKKGDIVVNEVVGWINSAKIAEGSIESFRGHGPPPPGMAIYDKLGEKGQFVTILPAYNIESIDNGKGSRIEPVKNELVVLQEGKGGYRIYSPELFNWLIGEWTKNK